MSESTAPTPATVRLVESLIAEKNQCRGDVPHSRSCKRCRRGAATAAARTPRP